MANEITLTTAITFSRSTAPLFKEQLSFSGVQVDQTGQEYSGGSQNIGTSEENLAKGDITTIGMVIIKNLDATNYIELGTTTGQLPVKVPAGEIALFRVDATNVIAKANSAGCDVQFLLIED